MNTVYLIFGFVSFWAVIIALGWVLFKSGKEIFSLQNDWLVWYFRRKIVVKNWKWYLERVITVQYFLSLKAITAKNDTLPRRKAGELGSKIWEQERAGKHSVWTGDIVHQSTTRAGYKICHMREKKSH
jgi:hypothetical protein